MGNHSYKINAKGGRARSILKIDAKRTCPVDELSALGRAVFEPPGGYVFTR
jgi:hypothetical protein